MPDPLLPGLYIVATPIGNLSDLSARARHVLAAADVIAVEDTRVTATLLRHIGVKVPMIRYDDHVGDRVRPELLARMEREIVALVSDAGTPLISDPGYKLVREARDLGRQVTTIPGPCAAIAGLTLAGLPTNRFLFMGFLPPKTKARRDAIAEIAGINATLVFYESGPRLSAMLGDLGTVLGDREAAVAREITKRFEECRTGSLAELAALFADQPPKGEIVVMVGPPDERAGPSMAALDARLAVVLRDTPMARAVRIVAKEMGADRETVAARAALIREPNGADDSAATG